jgi:uncharacterized protein YceH (UPF0502 family)
MTDLYKYPLDTTAVNVNNLIVNEEHELKSGVNRPVVLSQGPFYTESLKVRLESSGELLTPYDDYLPAQLFETPTVLIGKEICGVLVITNPNLTGKILVDYQVVGGIFYNFKPLLDNMLSSLDLDERHISWGDILGTPDVFPPVAHMHDIGDLYGFEYLVEAIGFLRDSIIMGDIRSYEEVMANIMILAQLLNDHIQDFNNPHQVTKTQVGLNKVENFPIATQLEAEEGIRNDRYMTPLRVKEATLILAGNILNQHIQDFNNPHQVTKTQVGLGSVENFPIATQLEAEEGIRNDRYMTPLRVKGAIDFFLDDALNQHIQDFNNPHKVTKTQVGLGSVENFPIATQLEAEEGLRNDRYMTPLRVKEAIDKKALNDLDSLYIKYNVNSDASIKVLKNPLRIMIYANYQWRQVWPAQWTN